MDEVLDKSLKDSVLNIDDYNRELGHNLDLNNNKYLINRSQLGSDLAA